MRYLIAAAVLGLAGSSFADIINVPADYTTIQAAVDAASNGDEILVAPGTYTGTGDEVVNTLGKPITIRATGTPEETIIDGEGARSVVHYNNSEGPDTIIEGFTITGGSANYGGLWIAGGSPTITDCTISNNTASSFGGGISCLSDCSPTITDCTITNNNSRGIYCSNSSSPTITDCTISNNTADENGGGIYCGSSGAITITGCTISGNTSVNGDNNDDQGNGGGIYCSGSGAITISDCEITTNSASGADWGQGGDGGGIYCCGSSPTISGCTIRNNTASSSGGGIWCSGPGFWQCPGESSPTITNCMISNNTADENGGGIDCYSSSLTISGCTISDNLAGGLGGGLSVASDGSCGVQDTSICSNIPVDPQVFGNWIDNGGNTIAEVCPWYQGACCTGNELACVVATEEDCEYFGHTWLGEGTTCDDSPCPTSCLGDVNADGEVSVNDILTVIANWGPCP